MSIFICFLFRFGLVSLNILFSVPVGCLVRSNALLSSLSGHEGVGQRNDFDRFFIESKMPSLKDVYFGARNVSLVSLRTGDSEGRIEFSPHDGQGRLMVPKPFLPGRVS